MANISCFQVILQAFEFFHSDIWRIPNHRIKPSAFHYLLKPARIIPIKCIYLVPFGLMNACHLTGRELRDTKLVVNGAGAAAIACVELLKAMGMRPEHVVLCDTKGVVYQGRTEGMNQWKSAHAAATKARTLTDALDGADVVFGLSVKGAVTKEMVSRMADKPIIFAMANPDPEITPEEAREARPNAIIATGRSDYPNQVNNGPAP